MFQEVDLPAGAFDAVFSYAPPHVRLAWLASLVGLAALLCGATVPLSLARQSTSKTPGAGLR